MLRYFSLACSLAFALATGTAATPKEVARAAAALVHVYTYDAANHLLGSTNGVLLGTDGTTLADYASFRTAGRAEIVTSTGSKATVERIAGANDIYNLIKLTTTLHPSVGLTLSPTPAAKGATLYVLSFSGKKAVATSTRVEQTAPASGGTYYTLSIPYEAHLAGCPVVDGGGKLVAIVQKAGKAGGNAYAVSADMGAALKISTLSFSNVSLQSLKMPRCLPEGEKEASTYLFLLAQAGTDSLIHITALNDFIATYPANADGYTERAKFHAAHGQFAACEADMKEAEEHTAQPDMPHYTLSRLIYQNVLHGTAKNYHPAWTLEAALAEADAAYAASPQPLYQLQQGQCLYGLKRYAEAYDRFAAVCRSSIASSETFFYAAQAHSKMNTGDKGTTIALLDSAVARLPKPYAAGAAPYFWERAKHYADSGLYRQAVLDLNEYEHLIGYRNLNDKFYYMREQAAMKGHLYQQAVDDINRCVTLQPNDYDYNVEKAALLLQLGQNDEALVTAQRAVSLNPQGSDGYKVLGIAYGETKQKRKAIENLQKAKQLGDTTIDELIKDYK